MGRIKFIIKALNEKFEVFYKRLLYARVLNLYIKLYKKYLVLFCSIQLGIIFLLSFYMDKILFFEKLYSVLIITFAFILIKYIYIFILKIFKWDGGFPVHNNLNINNFFKKYRILNYCFLLGLKYLNLYRVMLILRNKLALLLRYVRYFFIRYLNVYIYWVGVETIFTNILNFIFDYFVIIIDEVYLSIKIKTIELDLKYIFIGRIQLFLLVCLTKGMVTFIYLILVLKLIKLIKIKILNWVNDEPNYVYNEFEDLNWRLFKNSYILKNLNFKSTECYLGYNKIMPVLNIDFDMKDSLYLNEDNLRYYDIYKGLRTNEISELNYIIRNLFINRLFVEFCLKNNELSEFWNELSDLNKFLKESFFTINNILCLLKINNINFETSVIFQDYAPRLKIDLICDLVYIKNILKREGDLSFHKEIVKLHNLDFEYIKLYISDDKEYMFCYATFSEYFLKKYEDDMKGCLLEIMNEYINEIFLLELINE